MIWFKNHVDYTLKPTGVTFAPIEIADPTYHESLIGSSIEFWRSRNHPEIDIVAACFDFDRWAWRLYIYDPAAPEQAEDAEVPYIDL